MKVGWPMGGGARLMVGFHGRHPDPAFRDLLLETGARSVILFARNLVDASQAKDLIAEIRAAVPWPLLIAVDQEGGSVLRLLEGVTVFPGNMALGAAADPGLAYAQGIESGRQLAAIGFDLNLAPVVDLQTNPANPGIGIRSFGSDLEMGSALALALIRGHAEQGVMSCLKHFPGKGAAGVDAHLDLPVLETSLEEFRDPHLAIFARLCAAHERLAVMSTHLLVKGLDPERPATLSPRVIDGLLRQEIGFGGLVITDCLEMGAIVRHWGVPEAALLAAVAGHDLVPVCHTPERQRAAAQALDRALESGQLEAAGHAAAIARIERFAGGRFTAEPVDAGAGDLVARAIAENAVHLFGDERRLLPLRRGQKVAVVGARPEQVVAVEERLVADWEPILESGLAAAGITVTCSRVLDLAQSGDGDPLDPALLERVRQETADVDRVLVLGWNARGSTAMRAWLRAILEASADRAVVVHMRNPFDQALLPPRITALTAFGCWRVQIEALLAVLTGRMPARGCLPAPVV